MPTLLKKFIRYVKINTMSKENQNQTPSTINQFDLAKLLENELKTLGLTDIKISSNCFLTATLKSNVKSNLTIGFIAHMDTIPDVSGENVNPQIIENYEGEIINLNNKIKLDPKNFDFLNKLIDKTLITTDGTTVLGADDKAGIAEIMSMLQYFYDNPLIPHVNIRIAFTPDEEIGLGIEYFDITSFNADFAYTVDGGMWNEINYENFNAATAVVEFKGLDIHPGAAKDKMLNASLVAMEFNDHLPKDEIPGKTENYEGFYHLNHMIGEVGYAKLNYAVRNHSLLLFEKQKQKLEEISAYINTKYGLGTVTINIKERYFNMKNIIEKDMRSVDRAINAIKKIGYTPTISPIRGGTDGARLTQMGLLTPNLGTGSYNHHGPYELACLDEMELVVKTLIEIAKI